MGNNHRIAIFNGRSIRTKLFDDKWFFSILDIRIALSDEDDSIYSDVHLQTHTEYADTETIIQIISTLPSKKAQYFKRQPILLLKSLYSTKSSYVYN